MEEFNCPITNTDLSMLYARLHKPHPLNGQNKHESMITLIITTHMVLSYYHGWEFYEQKVPKRLLLHIPYSSDSSDSSLTLFYQISSSTEKMVAG